VEVASAASPGMSRRSGRRGVRRPSHRPELGIPPAERKFDVRAYRAPRIKTQIVFLRDGSDRADAVSATLQATRAEGSAPAHARVKVVARLDGREVHASTGRSTSGVCVRHSFKLPAAIERGEGNVGVRD